MTLGKRLSPVLSEIEDTLLDNYETKPGFDNDGFRASVFIFQSALLDKMWELQEKENLSNKIREEMATKCGEGIRNLIKTFTDIDTYKLYE